MMCEQWPGSVVPVGALMLSYIRKTLKSTLMCWSCHSNMSKANCADGRRDAWHWTAIFQLLFQLRSNEETGLTLPDMKKSSGYKFSA